jgi:integrase
LSAIDFTTGWIDFARPKTGTSRRCWAWPETVEAVRAAVAQRPKAKTKAAETLALLAIEGLPWVETNKAGANRDRLGGAFGRLLVALGLKRPGVSFYSLRRTFQTIGDDARDPVAVSSIMGHIAGSRDMSAVYRQRISDDRLRAVVDHVRGWLFGKGKR